MIFIATKTFINNGIVIPFDKNPNFCDATEIKKMLLRNKLFAQLGNCCLMISPIKLDEPFVDKGFHHFRKTLMLNKIFAQAVFMHLVHLEGAAFFSQKF